MRSRRPLMSRGWCWNLNTLSWTHPYFPEQRFRDIEAERQQAILDAIARAGVEGSPARKVLPFPCQALAQPKRGQR